MKYKMQNTKYKIRNTKYIVRSDPLPPTREQGEGFPTKYKTQNTENDKHWQSNIAQKIK